MTEDKTYVRNKSGNNFGLVHLFSFEFLFFNEVDQDKITLFDVLSSFFCSALQNHK